MVNWEIVGISTASVLFYEILNKLESSFDKSKEMSKR